jgi:hypothetical protein
MKLENLNNIPIHKAKNTEFKYSADAGMQLPGKYLIEMTIQDLDVLFNVLKQQNKAR